MKTARFSSTTLKLLSTLVNVVYRPDKTLANISVSKPSDIMGKGKPDCILPILNAWGLMGEIHIWRGSYLEVPPEDSRLLQNFAWQAGNAFERVQPLNAERYVKYLMLKAPVK